MAKAPELYEFQDFSYADVFGDNGFLEMYDSSIQGEPLKVVVTVTRNAAGQARISQCSTGPATRCCSSPG